MHPLALERTREFLGQIARTGGADIVRMIIEIEGEDTHPSFTVVYENNKLLKGILPFSRFEFPKEGTASRAPFPGPGAE